MAQRFKVVANQCIGTVVYKILDVQNDPHRVIATTLVSGDAEFIAAKLNVPFDQPAARWRPLQAWLLCDFRLHLEHDNDGPLTSDPTLALLLSELCDFLHFDTGERALALGAALLVYLDQLEFAPIDSIQIVETPIVEAPALTN